MSKWTATVGAMIAKHARPATLKDGVLWVEVDHPIWRTELHHRKFQILAGLNGGDAREKWVIKDLYLIEPRRGRETFPPQLNR